MIVFDKVLVLHQPLDEQPESADFIIRIVDWPVRVREPILSMRQDSPERALQAVEVLAVLLHCDFYFTQDFSHEGTGEVPSRMAGKGGSSAVRVPIETWLPRCRLGSKPSLRSSLSIVLKSTTGNLVKPRPRFAAALRTWAGRRWNPRIPRGRASGLP